MNVLLAVRITIGVTLKMIPGTTAVLVWKTLSLRLPKAVVDVRASVQGGRNHAQGISNGWWDYCGPNASPSTLPTAPHVCLLILLYLFS